MTDPGQLSPDALLSTTRAVRRRLDFDRPVELDVVRECLEIALQAPSGSNKQGWHWLVVTDAEQRCRVAELYLAAFDEYRATATAPGQLFADQHGQPGRPDRSDRADQQRVSRSVEYLARNLHRVPVLVLACVQAPGSAVLPDAAGATLWGSLFPAVWSYMLAARARGLGTAWTDLHLRHERQVAEVLGIPDTICQGPLIPTAYTIGTDFKPARRAPLSEVLHLDRW